MNIYHSHELHKLDELRPENVNYENKIFIRNHELAQADELDELQINVWPAGQTTDELRDKLQKYT